MRVLLRDPRREREVPGPVAVHALLERLSVTRQSVLVMRSDTVVTGDAVLADSEVARADLAPCSSCGATTPGDVYAVCKLRAKATAAS